MEARTALRIFGICGLTGVLVDLDHAIALFLWYYVSSKVAEGRIWHTPLFILSCLGICYLVSSLGGFHSKLILGGVLIVTILVLIFAPWVTWGLYE